MEEAKERQEGQIVRVGQPDQKEEGRGMCRGHGEAVVEGESFCIWDWNKGCVLVVVAVVLSAWAMREAICAWKSARGSVGMLRWEKGSEDIVAAAVAVDAKGWR